MPGCQVRKFLADLRAFEGLGVNALAEQAKLTAKKRREERDQKMRGTNMAMCRTTNWRSFKRSSMIRMRRTSGP
jgi:hypothetical protein